MNEMAKREKGLLPDFPLPGDPVEALENFSSMANRLQRTVDLIDGKLNVIDGTVTEIDKRFTSPTPPAELASEMKPKSGHLSYEGQSKVDYCLECCEKHGQTAKVLLREAIHGQRRILRPALGLWRRFGAPWRSWSDLKMTRTL